MKYCSKCGKQIMDEAVICPACGCAVAGGPADKSVYQESLRQGESSTLAYCALIFGLLMPIVGIILGIVGVVKYTDESLKKKCIYAILASILIWVAVFMMLV